MWQNMRHGHTMSNADILPKWVDTVPEKLSNINTHIHKITCRPDDQREEVVVKVEDVYVGDSGVSLRDFVKQFEK